MGKRQIILRPQDLKPEHVGEEVNVEMNDARVWHGYITAITPDEVVLRDLRRKDHSLKRADIKRVFAERVTEY
ncbi:MAG: hypothetical protein RMI34_01695 [Chloroherpetonaceae bacterium]|nr:hypothetical protein [Chloroherpetonaceae bacterium]MCS7211754.1 hypothetical protein [Chloroherpetonaceae bacterium]MDW8018769.1 hypothetical protein [Chloroherpetonaceae bacterium]MDW8465963.1 hypothetical protein [Chloroherpetonaceae bacterium]